MDTQINPEYELEKDPRKMGVPHPILRPAQRNALEKTLSMYQSGGGKLVIEAPTGVGKSAIPTALGHFEPVTVLVQNHGLLDQYESIYNFDIVKGKPEYDCVLPAKVEQWREDYGIAPTAGDCHFPNMELCPVAYKCPYLIARNKAIASNRMACTYKYASMSEAVRKRDGILVMDEAHNAYEEFINISQFQMEDSTRKKLGMPKFPLHDFGPGKNGDLLEGDNKSEVIDWFAKSLLCVSQADLFSNMTPEGSENQRIFDALMSGLSLLKNSKILFYKCTTPEEEYSHSKKPQLSLRLKSLDVKPIVDSLTGSKSLSILMSATIGNPKPLLSILGIEQYEFTSYPHPVPISKRPVYDLGFDRMTKRVLDYKPGLYKLQSERIADFIESLDPDWRGIVLTSSNKKVQIMRTFLKSRLNGRVMFPESNKLSKRIDEFMHDPRKGLIAVDTIQGWGSGISLVGDLARFSIVAGVPFANPGDRFDEIRMSSDEGRAYAFWNAYSSVVQATGRVSRGERNRAGEFMLNVGALADGSTTQSMALSSYSKWFREAITEWKR